MDFLQSFRNAYSGLKEGTEKKSTKLHFSLRKLNFFPEFFGHKFCTNSLPVSANLV